MLQNSQNLSLGFFGKLPKKLFFVEQNPVSMQASFLLVFFASLFSLPTLWAQQGLPSAAGARGAAMGNASLVFRDINSAFSNQAGLAFLESSSATLFAEQRFLLSEINSIGFAAAHPIQSVGTVGLMVQAFGFNAYNEQKVGLSYSRKLFKETSIGLQFDYLSTRIPDYGQAHTLTAELGFHTRLTKDWIFAGHVYNPFRSSLPNQDRLPTLFNLAFGFQPKEQILFTGGIEKDFDYPLRGKIGMEYRVVDALALRIGLSTMPWLSSFGLGLYLKNFNIDLAASFHPVLGFTPMVSLSYTLAKGQEKAKSKAKEE